ncbi:MAG: M20/M25/M40 family metallo-hydrolase [Pseudomonadota bacterium]|nr:M20/M25/M40 family metallo-hydrolase [Pseudomonadota bacterium]
MQPDQSSRAVHKPGLGKVLMGRGATNQKGPQAAFLAALHAIRAAGRKPPVNIVLVADGEEEIGSPSFSQVINRPEVTAALKRSSEIFLPLASQTQSGDITVYLGAKGWIELELIASGAKSGRGPVTDIHSSEKARVDSPAWRLVEALSSLVADGGNTPAIEGLMEKVRPLSREDLALVDIAAKRTSEADVQKLMGVRRWIDDMSWRQSLERLVSQPTVNIQGLISGYTGPGGKTILPGRAVAKLDLRLVPDMTVADTIAKLKAHLAMKGFSDVEVAVSGGYDPTTTPANSGLIRAAVETYRLNGVDPVLMPRLPGSWPGYIFTNEPLRLPAGHFGLGHGSGAHAPDEYYLIESSNPRVAGMAGATMSYVQFLYELAARN